MVSNKEDSSAIHDLALRRFHEISLVLSVERSQCLEDRRFYSVPGAQWENKLATQFENRAMVEINKVHSSVMRIINEWRNNRSDVAFISRDGAEGEGLADIANGLYRADVQDSDAEEAFFNAFEEAVGGGFGAFRLRAVPEDDEFENFTDEDDGVRQRISIEPIFDADMSVFFDLNAKKQDKSDAKYAFVVHSMTRAAYEEAYGEAPTTWPNGMYRVSDDYVGSDVVYVAEYYVVEEAKRREVTFRDVIGQEEVILAEDLDDERREFLASVGSVEVGRRTRKVKRIRKYLMSGSQILEDFGYIAGRNIPIIPVYGKRWFVENIERCMGHVRLAKDAQRLKNVQMSQLAEICTVSTVPIPVLLAEQIANYEDLWSSYHNRNPAYLLLNPTRDKDGVEQPIGPIAMINPPGVPPALAAVMQSSEADMQDLLGSPQSADTVLSNTSGRGVELVQSRIDMQSYIYISNFARSLKRCGTVWLSMARELYVEDGRKMKAIDKTGRSGQIELMKPVFREGRLAIENDLSSKSFDVVVEVGPSSPSKKSAVVQTIMEMLPLVQGNQVLSEVLVSTACLNMEGEGLNEVRAWLRKKLIMAEAIQPTQREAEEMAMKAAQAGNTPENQLLKAAAAEAAAKAEKAQAEVLNVVADAELKKAKTAEVFSEIKGSEHDRLLAAINDMFDRKLAMLEQRQEQTSDSI